MYVYYICNLIIWNQINTTISSIKMKTKLIILLCALMGVLNTFGQTIYVNYYNFTYGSTVRTFTNYYELRPNFKNLNDTWNATTTEKNVKFIFNYDMDADDIAGLQENWGTMNNSSIENISLDFSNCNFKKVSYTTGTIKGTYYVAIMYNNIVPPLYRDSSITATNKFIATKSKAITYQSYELPVYAFARMERLKSVILPKTVGFVNMNAFMLCTNLDSIVLPNTSFVYASEKLSDVYKKCYAGYGTYSPNLTVYVPKDLVPVYQADQYWGELTIKAIGSLPTNALQETKSNVSIYPTITKDVINIDGIESGQISIVDLNGNTMIKDEIQPQINVSKLPKGMYMVMVNNSCVGKIVKQ